MKDKWKTHLNNLIEYSNTIGDDILKKKVLKINDVIQNSKSANIGRRGFTFY